MPMSLQHRHVNTNAYTHMCTYTHALQYFRTHVYAHADDLAEVNAWLDGVLVLCLHTAYAHVYPHVYPQEHCDEQVRR